MKYSIRGSLNVTDESLLVNLLNNYTLWRLVTDVRRNKLEFEVWLNTANDKDSLFNELKPVVDSHGEHINWHECRHDEGIREPCIIVDEYRSS